MNEEIDRHQRIKVIAEALDERIKWITKEYDVTLTEMIGVMEVLKMNIMEEAYRDAEEEDDE